MELWKQAKGLRKVHMRDCLINAQTKRQHNHVREESKQMWHLIKRTVKDPHSPSMLKVQRVIGGETNKYTIQEDVGNVIQRKCKVRFSLAHSAPIMTTLLGNQLRYLGDEELAG